jgi:endoglycosylceramidase
MKIGILLLISITYISYVEPFITTNESRLFDEYGRERIFHGVNIVYKDKPWYPKLDVFDPQFSYCDEDMKLLKSWGFNAIRLGVMWPGVEPEYNKYNTTYIDILHKIVKDSEKYGIYVILDFHQDLLARQFCGEGVPDWVFTKPLGFPLPISLPYKKNSMGVSSRKDCDKHNWISYHFSFGASHGFQLLYTDLSTKFADFWRLVASRFKDSKNIIGYEIINEPWAGDIYFFPSLLWPTFADYHNLQPFYDKIARNIFDIDDNHLILFQSVTWSIFRTGFTHTPGNRENKTILSYHGYYPPNFSARQIFNSRNWDMKRLKCGGILTEFSVGSGTISHETEIYHALNLINHADRNMQSWFIWEYKKFIPITGSNYGFFYPNGSYTEAKNLFSRPYAQAVAGKIIDMEFFRNIGKFKVSFIPNFDIKKPTIIYINKEMYYSDGYTIDVIPPTLVYSIKDKDGYIEFYINRYENTNITITISPNYMDPIHVE